MSFWTVFAAILGANLLSVLFLWGLFNYSRSEARGTAGQSSTHRYAVAAILPLGILACALILAFDQTPAWLNAILQ